MREERGITLDELALRCGVSAGALAQIERAELAPGWSTVRLLASGLGVSMVELSAAVEGGRRSPCPTSGRSHFSRR
jgi:transcriptional regulator with XRE-family HTH domain